MDNTQNLEQKERKKGFSGLQVAGIGAAVMVVTVVITLAAARTFLFPAPFRPVDLTPAEQRQLEAKLDRVESFTRKSSTGKDGREEKNHAEKQYTRDGRVVPQPYSEEGADREIFFSERELNALIATNTDLADKLAIDLADDLVSARMLIPLDPDFPVFGGKTLRLKAGVELAYRAGRPVVRFKGVSLMGAPLPNAWLGGIKNLDLVEEFGTDQGFWKGFADGVEAISVEEGRLYILLKE